MLLTSACSHLSKPILDAATILFSLFQLGRAQEANTSAGPVLAGVVVWTTGRLLRLLSPRFGELVAEHAARQAALRHTHARAATE